MKNEDQIWKNYIGKGHHNFNLFVSIISVFFIFFWSLENSILNLRYLILLLIFPTIICVIYNFKNKDYFFIINFLLISFFLISHLTINQLILGENIKISTFYGVVFFLLIYAILYFYSLNVIQNLELIVFTFLIIFVFSSFISLINYQQDAPYFCGGLKNFLNIDLGLPVDPNKNLIDYNLSFKHILFKENSHLGMTAPAVIVYSIFKITTQKKSKIFTILATLFFIICLIKSSTTLFVGTILSILIISFFNFKNISNKTLIVFAIVSIVFTTIILTDKQCKIRFIPAHFGQDIISKEFTDFTHDKLFKEKNSNDQVKKYGSASSSAFFRSLLISKYSLEMRPLGWGINRYSDGFDAYRNKNIKDFNLKFEPIENLNRKDGVNNFNKIIVEFGYLSIFIFIFILLYLTNKKINLEEKLFFLPIIITQMIRGAGYFNGGFTLILIIMFLTYLNLKKDQKK